MLHICGGNMIFHVNNSLVLGPFTVTELYWE